MAEQIDTTDEFKPRMTQSEWNNSIIEAEKDKIENARVTLLSYLEEKYGAEHQIAVSEDGLSITISDFSGFVESDEAMCDSGDHADSSINTGLERTQFQARMGADEHAFGFYLTPREIYENFSTREQFAVALENEITEIVGASEFDFTVLSRWTLGSMVNAREYSQHTFDALQASDGTLTVQTTNSQVVDTIAARIEEIKKRIVNPDDIGYSCVEILGHAPGTQYMTIGLNIVDLPERVNPDSPWIMRGEVKEQHEESEKQKKYMVELVNGLFDKIQLYEADDHRGCSVDLIRGFQYPGYTGVIVSPGFNSEGFTDGLLDRLDEITFETMQDLGETIPGTPVYSRVQRVLGKNSPIEKYMIAIKDPTKR